MKRIIAMVCVAVLLLCLLPVSALALPIWDYSVHDSNALRTFLDMDSGTGVSNGVLVSGSGYISGSPSTWGGVSWVLYGNTKYVSGIDWEEEGVTGALDLSNFTYLETVYVGGNSLGGLSLNGDTALTTLDCSYCGLTALDLSDNTGLLFLDCSGNSLTALGAGSCTALTTLYCYDDGLTALDVSKLTALTTLDCSDNALGTLDVGENTALLKLNCDNNRLSALDVSGLTVLTELKCRGNQLTALNVSDNPVTILRCEDNQLSALDLSGKTTLLSLLCSNNQLTALDTIESTSMIYLDCTGNPMTSLSSSLGGQSVALSAGTGGYIGLLYAPYNLGAYYAEARARIGAAFYDWTNAADAQVSTMAQTDLSSSFSYDLTANFLYLNSSVSGGTIYTGGRITLTPSVDGGEWDWDEDYFSATFNSPATFTGLKAGISTITYTVQGVSTTYDVTIEESNLPSTGQDYTWVWVLMITAGVLITAGMFSRRKKHRKA